MTAPGTLPAQILLATLHRLKRHETTLDNARDTLHRVGIDTDEDTLAAALDALTWRDWHTEESARRGLLAESQDQSLQAHVRSILKEQP